MKLFILLFLPVFSLAQDTAISFTEVVEVKGQNQEQLFIKARQWLNEAIKSSKTALQIADKETGELSGKSYLLSVYRTGLKGKYNSTASVYYAFDFSIFVKDGRYKYIFTQFKEVDIYGAHSGYGLVTSADTVLQRNMFIKPAKATAYWRRQKVGLIENMTALIENLKESMTKESKTDF